ncbi:hypothetical protein LZ578_04935 [Jeotgalibaca sp. MA1X17-3]|uniref:hypothetical protein n=1 Tax=Jeotgalibaca sp. MA1X17-3 TaxID=2908211 RepID=UPI001F267E10|nr:hypothetical protein [Jeotgalibaca sp. MA1X17-3]UJF16454.1 hypothetical protein LZ578_04935 [Jeotgalibaca sp. MA1X17-3]
MRLKIMLPYKTILDKDVLKITAPGVEGVFQILPNHVDGTWSLKAGILVINIVPDDEIDRYYAISQGVIVKEGDVVYLTCFQAIKGDSLENVADTVRKDLEVMDERERKAQEVLIKLEVDTVRRFMELDK